MSGGLAPSKSTCYVGNLPFHLTNNDIHQVFEKFGKIIKVTILRDKQTRESKGVAFIQFIDRDCAINACKGINQKQLFERTIKCVLAKDNGRSTEFIKKKEYPDKSSCYECGSNGHLSYKCPKNYLGNREPPVKKEKKFRKRKIEMSSYVDGKYDTKRCTLGHDYEDDDDDASDDNVGEDPRLSSLSAVIETEATRYDGSYSTSFSSSSNAEYSSSKKKLKKSSYFSDEEEEIDGD